MKSIIFNNEILDVEKKIIQSLGIPSIVLMENAGSNSTNYLISNFKEELSKPVIILTGKGNNAGDGFVISRHLAIQGYSSVILMLYPESVLKGDAKVYYDVLCKLDNDLIGIVKIDSAEQMDEFISGDNQLILDAVFGVGFKGELEPYIAEIFKKLNSINNVTRIAIDVPSGLESYNQTTECFKAEHTLSMGVKKFSSLFYYGKESSGEVTSINIGVPDSEFDKYNVKKIFEVQKQDIKNYIPKRQSTSYKYSSGKVFILSGAEGYTGAAYLSSQSALRTGSGAVILGVPLSLMEIMEKKLTDVVKYSLPETNEKSFSIEGFEQIKEKIEWSDVTLLGPGIGRNIETMHLIRKIIKEVEHNYVIDADGLFALNEHIEILKQTKSKIIITPHFGEFSSLLGISIEELRNNFYHLAKNFASEFGVTLILKNAPSITTDGDSFYINSSGHQNLATVGTGDVLSGIVTSLFSQSDELLHSALAGTYLHGFCGDVLFEKTGDSSTIASDLIPLIPKVKHYLSK